MSAVDAGRVRGGAQTTPEVINDACVIERVREEEEEKK